ncbi:MAG: response regulator, partial [Pseudobdellovibrionaceae bacterium]
MNNTDANQQSNNQLVSGYRDFGYRTTEKASESHVQAFIPNVLVIEDSLEYQAIIRNSLERDLHLFFASNLKQAKEILESREVHLILLDVMLPDGSGFDYCNDLQTNPATARIPVIFLTGKTGVTDKILGLSLGAEDYITKPFVPLELKARIESKLKKSLLHDRNELQLQRGH